jgi:hypothetical protein
MDAKNSFLPILGNQNGSKKIIKLSPFFLTVQLLLVKRPARLLVRGKTARKKVRRCVIYQSNKKALQKKAS